MTKIKGYYEKSQVATQGPILFSPWGLTWRDHFQMAGGLLVLFIIVVFIVYYNLTILYRFNPGYGHNLEIEQAFCVEVDRQFASSRYEWSQEELMCKKVEAEVRSNEN